MINGVITILTFVSAVAFPWQLTAALSLIGALFVPLLPISAGVFLDAIYFTNGTGYFPMFSIFGAVTTIVAYILRSRLARGIMG